MPSKRNMITYAIVVDWPDIRCLLVVRKNISLTYIMFHLKSKINNITLTKINVEVKNAFVEANSIIPNNVLNLDASNFF